MGILPEHGKQVSGADAETGEWQQLFDVQLVFIASGHSVIPAGGPANQVAASFFLATVPFLCTYRRRHSSVPINTFKQQQTKCLRKWIWVIRHFRLPENVFKGQSSLEENGILIFFCVMNWSIPLRYHNQSERYTVSTDYLILSM